jgi:hypothetical protein
VTRPPSGRTEHAAVNGAAAQQYDVLPRKGNLLRCTDERSVSAICLDCFATFDSTGTAASHARSRRHTVDCEYSTRFRFVPRENRRQLGGGL